MTVGKISGWFACFLFMVAAFVVHPDQASAQNSTHCDGYARDFAQRNSTGHVARGATRGVIGGGLIGGIIGGGKGFGVGALIGALPWMTVLVMVWLAVEKQGSEKIANHAYYTFWFGLPTLPMFLLIPWMMRRGIAFAPALLAGIALSVVCFLVTAWAAKGLGVKLI